MDDVRRAESNALRCVAKVTPMDLPFTAQQFFDVFRRYNEAIWPGQFVLNAIAVTAALAAYRANLRQSRRAAQTAIVLIAILWLWTGVVYHGIYFRTRLSRSLNRVNPASKVTKRMPLLLANAAR